MKIYPACKELNSFYIIVYDFIEKVLQIIVRLKSIQLVACWLLLLLLLTTVFSSSFLQNQRFRILL